MANKQISFFILLIFAVSAFLEVGGDIVVRKGLRGSSVPVVITGMLMLGFYGLLLNTVKWDFSKLFGVYVAVFALASVLSGLLVFKENIPFSTWLGLGIVIAGGLIIQFGPR